MQHIYSKVPCPPEAHGTKRGYSYHRCRCDSCRGAWSAYMREFNQKRMKDPEVRAKRNAAQVAEMANLRMEVIAAYGGMCSCCGEGHVEFLALDHVDGGGYDAKRKCHEGRKAYRKARREGFPDTYRILCHNCNMAFGLYGVCPHQVEGSA